jgi:hypothetical protein
MTRACAFAGMALAAGLLAAVPVHANKILQDGVDDVELTVQGGIFEVTIKDFSGGTSVAAVDIKPVTTHLTFPVQTRVKCAKSSGGYSHTDVGFGAFNPTFGDTLVMHHELNPSGGYTQWSGGQWISQAPFTHQFQASLSALKNPAYPDYELDPVAEFYKAMQQFVSQGGSQIDFLRQDRVIEVQKTLSAMGACWSGFSGKALGRVNAPVTIRIKYQGNPNLTNVNVAIGQQPGGIQVGDQPLQIIGGEILPYAPNYVGACPTELKFRVRLTAAGKGEVRYRINEGGSSVYESPVLASPGGEVVHEFVIPLPFEGAQHLNQTKQRTFTLHARGKDQNDNFWPAHWQHYGSQGWTYRCTPQVSIGVGGVGPGGATLAPGAGSQPAGPGAPGLQAPAGRSGTPGTRIAPPEPQPPVLNLAPVPLPAPTSEPAHRESTR